MKTVYNGIEISYNEDNDSWEFELRGRNRSAASLTKAKDAIDKEPKEKRQQTFPRFDAYMFKFSRDPVIVTVTSIAEKGYSTAEYFWVVSQDGSRSKESATSIYPVDEKNTAIVDEIKRLSAQINGLENTKSAQFQRLQHAKIPKELAV